MPDDFGRETANERFERLASMFLRDTGMMAPGKSEAPEMSYHTIEERLEKWDLWMAAQRLAAPKPPGDIQIRDHLNRLITRIMTEEFEWQFACSRTRADHSFANSFTSPTMKAVDEHLSQFLDVLRAASDQLEQPGTPDGRNPKCGIPDYTANNR